MTTIKKNKAQSKKQQTTGKPSLKSAKISEQVSSSSIWDRKWDIGLIIFYIIFTCTTALIDYHNVLAPMMGMSVPDMCKAEKPLNWPPAFWTRLYEYWAEKVDPVMYQNPVYWQIMEWINVVFLAPGNLVMVYAFWKGVNSLKDFGMIHSAALLYSMMLCIFGGMYGEVPSHNFPQFMYVYSVYATMPIAIMARLWGEKPFSTEYVRTRGWLSKLLQALAIIHMVVFVFYVYHWWVAYTDVLPGYPDWYPYVEDLATAVWNVVIKVMPKSA